MIGIGNAIIARHTQNATEAASLKVIIANAKHGSIGWIERLVASSLADMRRVAVEEKEVIDREIARKWREENEAKERAKVALLGEVTEGHDALRYLLTRRFHVWPVSLAEVNDNADALRVYMSMMPVVEDPGPGYWDINVDFRTETVTPAERRQSQTFVWRGRTFRVRTGAPSHCPSGPCGTEVTLHRIS